MQKSLLVPVNGGNPLNQGRYAIIDGELQSIEDKDVYGEIAIEVNAFDGQSGMNSIELKMDNDIIKTVYQNPSNPKQLKLSHNLHTCYISNASHTLIARAVDKAGNASNIPISFNSIDPSWGVTEPPVAEITNLNDDTGSDDFDREPLPVVDKGLFELMGAAYHPDASIPEVQYKIELFKNQIGGVDVKYWKPPYLIYYDSLVKNITPGTLYEDGFCVGKIKPAPGELGASFGTLDFTSIENGPYQLLLTVKCGGLYSYANVGFVLDTQLKIGNVKFSQEDLVIPAGAVPLRVIRTYDSFKKNQDGDFGFGWAYSIANMDIQIDEERVEVYSDPELGSGSDRMVRFGSNYNRNVTLTLPDGRRTTFLFYLEYVPGNIWEGELPSYKAKYASPPGVYAILETEDEESIELFGLWEGQGYCGLGLGFEDPENYDFSGYVLTTEDGTKYHFEREGYDGDFFVFNYGGLPFWAQPKGPLYLNTISTPGGEEIHLNVDLSNGHIGEKDNEGIEHIDAEGDLTKAIKIAYENNRIIKIWAPSEQGGIPTIKYVYDAYGNLIEVHKLVDKTIGQYEITEYAYDNNELDPADYYVTDIIDPRGLKPIRYVYDQNDRLQKVIDAKGNEIVVHHDIDSGDNTETVEDRYGNLTVYGYNERGNVISVTNALGQTTYDYNDVDNPDEPNAVSVLLSANPSQWATMTHIYDNYPVSDEEHFGQLSRHVVIDPEDNVTDIVYDTKGNVTITVQGILDSLEPLVYTEVSTNRNSYNDENLLILTGTTTGEEAGLTWHSLTLNYYDSLNRITYVVQFDVAYLTNGIEDVFEPGYPATKQLKNITSLPGYSDNAHSITTYAYDKAYSNSPDQPYSITNPAGNSEYFYYDDNGNQIISWYHWEDPNNSGNACKVSNITEYDDMGRVIRTKREVSNATGSLQEYSVVLSETKYNDIGKVNTVYDEYGNYTKYDYDELGNLVETRTYDSDGIPLTIAQTLYDKEGRVLVTVGPYDPTSPQLPVGTENVYDALGRVTETRKWADVQITAEDVLNAGGQVVGRRATGWTTQGAGAVAGNELSYNKTIYDTAGRVKMTIALDEDGYEQPTGYKYDSAGKQTAVADANDYGLEVADYTEDGKWHVIEDMNTILSDGYIDGLDNISRTEYKGNQRWKVTDDRNNTTEFVYDALGRAIMTIHPPTIVQEGGVDPIPTYSHVGYDGLGRKVCQAETTSEPNVLLLDDADGLRWFDYDTAGRLVGVKLPAPDSSQPDDYPYYRYIYDDYGNMAGILDPLVRLTVFKYDERNNQTAKYMPFVVEPNDITDAASVYYELAHTSPAPKSQISDYNDLGQLIKVTDFKGQITGFTYNNRGQLWYKKYYNSLADYPSSPAETIEYTYDELGRTEQVIVDGITEQDFEYDAEGRIITIATPQGEIGYDYNDITGQREFVRTPADGGDTEVQYTYDELGRLADVIVNKRNGVSATETTSYNYNPVGSIDQIMYANSITAKYTYDALNRLTDLVNKNASQKTLSSFRYALMADGQRADVNNYIDGGEFKIDWSYDNLNRLTGERWYDNSGDYFTYRYFYDLAGSRQEKTYIEPGIPDAMTYYFYNDLDQLDYTAGAEVVDYDYDLNGSLILQQQGSNITTYTYNLQNRLEQLKVNGVPSVTYSYNPDGIRVKANNTNYLIDPYNHTGYAQVFVEKPQGGNNTTYIIGSDIVAQATGSANPVYLLYDGQGSVRELANNIGGVISGQVYYYDGYGNEISGASPATNLLYAGEMWDGSLGMYNLRARYYNPSTGRFNQTDSFSGNLQDPQSLHKYLYCHANPVNRLDPTGEFSLLEIDVTAAIQATLMTMNVTGVIYHAKGLGVSVTGLYNAWSMGDFWDGLPYVIISAIHGGGMVWNIIGAYGCLNPPPSTGTPALALAGGGQVAAERFWTVVVANPHLARWVVKRIAPPAFSAYMALSLRSSGPEWHHKVPPENKRYDHENHPLVKKAGWTKDTLKNNPRNKMLLDNHHGRHINLYHEGVDEILDDALERVGNGGQRKAERELLRALDEIERKIIDGELKPYKSKDVYVP